MSGCGGCPDDGAVTKSKSIKKAKGKALEMTKDAAEFVKKLLKKDDKAGWGLKVEVVPGGCAGYKYFMGFQEKAVSDEKTFEFHGVKLFLSDESFEMLHGSTIEFTRTLAATGLKVNNPNATRACGCGKSFG